MSDARASGRTVPRWLRVAMAAIGSDDLRRDVERLDDARFRRSPAVAAVVVLRLKQAADTATGLRRFAMRVVSLPLTFVSIVVAIDIPPTARIGGGFVINHFGGIFFESTVVMGADCSVCQGVTVGNRVPGGPTPVIGDRVEIGAYAQILGGVSIGDGARIGAMTVVLHDVPAGATVVGNPARQVAPRAPEDRG